MYFLSKKLYSKLQINSPNHNEQSACREKVTTELLTEYSQSTVPLPVSSIGRTNRKYLLVYTLYFIAIVGFCNRNCVMCDPAYKKKIADIVTQNFFFNE